MRIDVRYRRQCRALEFVALLAALLGVGSLALGSAPRSASTTPALPSSEAPGRVDRLPSAARTPPPDLAGAIDRILSANYKSDEPGAAAIVVKDGKVLLRKGYGMANLELGVPVRPEQVFRLYSVTKQFTAAAIMLLEERGKLSVADPITKYLPDYPTQGRTITIEHLLTHTSGIASYTDLQEFATKGREDLTVDDLIALFKDKPMLFAPGERWSYCNSGYILLGKIIETVSGQSYPEFIRKNIFDRLGMKHSGYGTEAPIVPGRVAGYDRSPDGFVNAQFLSMSTAYAAGALVSNVDDLVLWDAALSGGSFLTKASLEKMFTPFRLNGGETTGYGYGWGVGEVEGHRLLEHSGGAPGFRTDILRVPEEHLMVAILQNRADPDSSPEYLAQKIAFTSLGLPVPEFTAVTLDTKTLDALTGVYRIDDKSVRVVTREGSALYTQRTGGPRLEAIPASDREIFYRQTFTWMTFDKTGDGKVTRMTMHQIGHPDEVAARTDEPLPRERAVARLDPNTYDRYVGRYELAPGFILTVSHEGNHLMTQATGQQQIEIFPESETEWFVKVVDAQITFVKDAGGAFTSLILHQAGRNIPAPRLATGGGTSAGATPTVTPPAPSSSAPPSAPPSASPSAPVPAPSSAAPSSQPSSSASSPGSTAASALPSSTASARPSASSASSATDHAAHPAHWDGYVGEYQIVPGFSITITIEGAHLMAQATGQGKYEIFERSETEYSYKVVDAQIRFEKDSTGKVARLVLHQNGHDMPGRKLNP